MEEVPFCIPDVIFKSLQLSFLKAVRGKWLHMHLSGCKQAVESTLFVQSLYERKWCEFPKTAKKL